MRGELSTVARGTHEHTRALKTIQTGYKEDGLAHLAYRTRDGRTVVV